MPMMIMGGNDFMGWFKAAGRGAGINTFHSYGNGKHIAPQLAAAGRDNVFVAAGIPCGCCGNDAPRWQPMNVTTAMWYIDDELAQLNTSYVDLLVRYVPAAISLLATTTGLVAKLLAALSIME